MKNPESFFFRLLSWDQSKEWRSVERSLKTRSLNCSTTADNSSVSWWPTWPSPGTRPDITALRPWSTTCMGPNMPPSFTPETIGEPLLEQEEQLLFWWLEYLWTKYPHWADTMTRWFKASRCMTAPMCVSPSTSCFTIYMSRANRPIPSTSRLILPATVLCQPNKRFLIPAI